MAALTHDEKILYARQLVQCLQMWDIERDDAGTVAQLMREIIRDTEKANWKNPLAGTGFSAIKASDQPNAAAIAARFAPKKGGH